MFTVVAKTTDTEAFVADAQMSRGFTDGTNHRAQGWAAQSAVATSNTGRATITNRCIALTTFAGAALNAATCAMDADGFTLTWDSTPAAAYRIMYEAFGGTDITNVAVGHITEPTAAGVIDTNIGFVGDVGFFLSSAFVSSSHGVHASHGFGMAVSSTKEWVCSMSGGQDAQTMAANVNAVSVFLDDACIAYVNPIAATLSARADFVSFNQGATNNTFRVNFSVASVARFHPYMVIKGGRWDVGSSTKPTANPSIQTISGIAFQPTIVGVATSSATALNTVTSHGMSAYGASTGDTSEVSAGGYSDDVINTVVNQWASSTRILFERTANVEADFLSFYADGFDMGWGGAVGVASYVGWWAAADNVVLPRPQSPIVVNQAVMRSANF